MRQRLRRCEFSYYDLPAKLFRVYSDSDLFFYIDSKGKFYVGNQNPNSAKELGDMDDVKEYLSIFV